MTRRLWPLVTAAALLVVGWYFWQWSRVSSLDARGSDFSVAYVAGMLVRHGEAGQIYNQNLEAFTHAQILPPGAHFNLPYISPPPVALIGAAWTLLDPVTAYRAWGLMQFACLLAACVVAARTARASDRAAVTATIALALAATATFPFLLLGQWGGFMALALAGAYRFWKRDQDFAAVLLLALVWGAIKPHLMVVLLAWSLMRNWRSTLAAAATALLLLAAATLPLFGIDGTLGFLAALNHAYHNTPLPSTAGIFGLFTAMHGDSTAAIALSVAAAVAAVAGAALLGRNRGLRLESQLAAAGALSLVASPHLMTHDLVVLAPLFVALALARVVTASRRRAAYIFWLALGIATAADAGNGALFPPGRVVPWVLLAYAIWEASGAGEPRSLQSPAGEPNTEPAGLA